MVLRGRRINTFVDFSLKTCSGAMGTWVSSINFYILKWHGLSSTASSLKDTKIELEIPWLPKLNLKFHDSTQKFLHNLLYLFTFTSNSSMVKRCPLVSISMITLLFNKFCETKTTSNTSPNKLFLVWQMQ